MEITVLEKKYNQFCNYHSERAELKVQEMIEKGMRGRPGLHDHKIQVAAAVY